MAQSYKVVGPLVISKKQDGSDLYLYENAILPDYASADEIKRLVSLGLVEKVTSAEVDAAPEPTSQSN